MMVIWGLLALMAAAVVVLAVGGAIHLWKRGTK